jgi:predicted flavoprotein YhiN
MSLSLEAAGMMATITAARQGTAHYWATGPVRKTATSNGRCNMTNVHCAVENFRKICTIRMV